MTVKPCPRPRLAGVTTLPPPLPVAVVRIARCNDAFCYYAKSTDRVWSGEIAAPTKEAALLEVFRAIQGAFDSGKPIRFLLSLSGASPIWHHTADLAAVGCLVERATFADQPLVRAADLGLKQLISNLSASSSASSPADSWENGRTTTPTIKCREIDDIIVATDGSVRRHSSGFGWLTGDGRYGLRGGRALGKGRKMAVLLAELRAIDDALQALHPHRLTVLSDSTDAIALIEQWRAGRDSLPAGFPHSVAGTPSPLLAMRERIHDSRGRLRCRWVKAHCGDPLNEGADALARLASRYVRGDSGLTESDYTRRAAGLAEGFSSEFARRCA